MKTKITYALMFIIILSANYSFAECFGSGEYRVCTESYTDSNGDIHVRSWDSEGNNYQVDTESHIDYDGDVHIRSWDSEGNSYSVDSE